jgi:hypothetical protein
VQMVRLTRALSSGTVWYSSRISLFFAVTVERGVAMPNACFAIHKHHCGGRPVCVTIGVKLRT